MMRRESALFAVFILCLIGVAVVAPLLQERRYPAPAFDAEEFADFLADSGIAFASSQVEVELLEYRKIVIATDINAASAARVIKSLLLLDALDPAAPIDLYIRTGGGWLSDAFAIIDTMQSIQAPVNTHAIGGTFSAGSMILAAGTGVRYGYPFSAIMFHAGLYEDDGQYGGDRLDNQRWVTFWQTYAQVPPGWVQTYDEQSFFIGPEDAVAFGIIDEVRRVVL